MPAIRSLTILFIFYLTSALARASLDGFALVCLLLSEVLGLLFVSPHILYSSARSHLLPPLIPIAFLLFLLILSSLYLLIVTFHAFNSL